MESMKKFVDIDSLEIVKELSEGNQGSVSQAKVRGTENYYAVKTYFDQSNQEIEKEVEALSSLTHENIVKLCGFDEQHLILEFHELGDMIDVVNTFNQNGQGVPEAEVKKFARQIMNALKYMHDNNWVHRDIKLENMLLSDDGQLKISDFGNAEKSPVGNRFNDSLGTLRYKAPETFTGNLYCPRKADVFAAGVSILTMALGCPPFGEASLNDLHFRAFLKSPMIYWKQMTSKVSLTSEFKDLMSQMLASHSGSRLGVDSVLQHQWLQD